MTQVDLRAGEDFGRAVAEARRRKGISQTAMAEESGLSRSYLSQLETGRTTKLLDHYFDILRHADAKVTVTFPEEADG